MRQLSTSDIELIIAGVVLPTFFITDLVLLGRWIIVNQRTATIDDASSENDENNMDIRISDYYLSTGDDGKIKEQQQRGKQLRNQYLRKLHLMVFPLMILMAFFSVVSFFALDLYYIFSSILPKYQTQAVIVGYESGVVDNDFLKAYTNFYYYGDDSDGQNCEPNHQFAQIFLQWSCPLQKNDCLDTIISMECGSRSICQEDCKDEGNDDDRSNDEQGGGGSDDENNRYLAEQYNCFDENGDYQYDENDDDGQLIIDEDEMLQCAEHVFPKNETLKIVTDCSRCSIPIAWNYKLGDQNSGVNNGGIKIAIVHTLLLLSGLFSGITSFVLYSKYYHKSCYQSLKKESDKERALVLASSSTSSEEEVVEVTAVTNEITTTTIPISRTTISGKKENERLQEENEEKIEVINVLSSDFEDTRKRKVTFSNFFPKKADYINDDDEIEIQYVSIYSPPPSPEKEKKFFNKFFFKKTKSNN
eukprot:CAMPEP_0194147830 /NCGR_PEP_ID=MMETSP0152-20130528/28112_1 /TAXON_ID=1049557 /ORGANISM="Thalassiothrix antarctica, Strain L6-D1" /LENGTH=473 /DNA_ID=CAMNT_0038848921 /DNA_START=90 /DNA_END=1511 /DNA_ORIENTATION=+